MKVAEASDLGYWNGLHIACKKDTQVGFHGQRINYTLQPEKFLLGELKIFVLLGVVWQRW